MNPAAFQHALITAVIVIAIVVVVRFEIFCLRDIAHARQTRYLTRAGWAAVCVVAIPVGGIVYLCCGRMPK
jgi:hypothetical protein